MTAQELVRGFAPENELERALAEDPILLEGLAWGKPRRAHPEGSVANHLADLLERIDESGEEEPRRSELRLISLIHDSLKYRVHEWLPHKWSNQHARRARRFAERYLDDERLLSTIELHDRPYSLWKRMRRRGRLDDGAFGRMLERLADPALFLRFVELDGSTEGKDPRPIEWLGDELRRRGAL